MKILPSATTWMNPEDTALCEMSDKEKQTRSTEIQQLPEVWGWGKMKAYWPKCTNFQL